MYKKKILVFAGTYEGHRLAELCSSRGFDSDFCVATEYGSKMLEDLTGINIIEGRLVVDDMIALMKDNQYGLVVDATHPYAQVVTENIKEACKIAEISYSRLLREESLINDDDVIAVDSIDEAVKVINRNEDNVLLTTGSKELAKYAGIKNLEERVYARILPSIESLNLAFSSGLPPKHIICMQGPFSSNINLALMEELNCKTLVTKNTGKAGGFDDKLACAEKGFRIIVIGRPLSEDGKSLEEIWKDVEAFYE